jgi:RNA polymerase sigma-70 factor (ECF subfamily)
MTGVPHAEADLVRRARDGDDGALCALLDHHEGALRRRIERLLPGIVRRRVAVSDILQETRIGAVERRGEFEWRGQGSFGAWLLAIAENRTRRAIERNLTTAKRSLLREVTRAARPETGHLPGPPATPSQQALRAEAERLAREAMATLPRDYREVLRLCREEGLTLGQAGERLARSREATKKLYGRAIARFTKVFRQLHGGDRGA